MGEIVAAIGTAHSPYSFTRPPDEKADEIDLSIECMKELGRILDETKPDVIIFIGNDHLETFSMTCMPTFAIIAGNYAHAEWAGRECKLPVHREMAEDMLEKLIDRGFDIVSHLLGAVRPEDRDVPLLEQGHSPHIPSGATWRARCTGLVRCDRL